MYNTFKGVAWINYNHFLTNRPINLGNEKVDADWFRHRIFPDNYRRCPEDYLLKLELKRYAVNTVRTYVTFFEQFINYYPDKDPYTLSEMHIRAYLQRLIRQEKSNAYLN